jgi:hypothetical protein
MSEYQEILVACGRCKELVPVEELVYVEERTGPGGTVLWADGLRCRKCRPTKDGMATPAGERGAAGG